ncbi:MAG: radical SAM protein [Pontiellaceae bacterium]|jgi:23S rRNA (adenine2503-C2)-methyltransferase|nr:radical SAM protein [Pontiellaceae bacterium]
MLIRLKNQTAEELHQALAPLSLTPRQARQIQASVLRTGKLPEAQEGLPAKTLRTVRDAVEIPDLTLMDKAVSPQDGFVKYLFQGDGPDLFEAVRIPLLHHPDDPKYIVCVSSQIGCAMGCSFCFTGRMGFKRNLAAWEIVNQVIKIRDDSAHPVRGVVFMGMGEPLLNYDAVIRAARILSEPCGAAISGKAITLSTVGIVSGIRRFTAERQPFRLVVSLTSADPQRRRELLPVETICSIDELMEALRERSQVTGERITLAWIMMSGINTGEQDARQLAELTRGLPVKLDLIDVNDPSGQYRPPSTEELSAFRDALRLHLAAPVARRYSGGRDIHAACGMLAGTINQTAR